MSVVSERQQVRATHAHSSPFTLSPSLSLAPYRHPRQCARPSQPGRHHRAGRPATCWRGARPGHFLDSSRPKNQSAPPLLRLSSPTCMHAISVRYKGNTGGTDMQVPLLVLTASAAFDVPMCRLRPKLERCARSMCWGRTRKKLGSLHKNLTFGLHVCQRVALPFLAPAAREGRFLCTIVTRCCSACARDLVRRA